MSDRMQEIRERCEADETLIDMMLDARRDLINDRTFPRKNSPAITMLRKGYEVIKQYNGIVTWLLDQLAAATEDNKRLREKVEFHKSMRYDALKDLAVSELAAHPEVRIKSCPDKWFPTGRIWWETLQVQVLEAPNVINTVDFNFILEWRGPQQTEEQSLLDAAKADRELHAIVTGSDAHSDHGLVVSGVGMDPRAAVAYAMAGIHEHLQAADENTLYGLGEVERMDRPEIVCLCGSTRFFKEFDEQNFRLTLEGKIVLSIGCNTKSDEGLKLTAEDKERLDELHKRKIDLCDRVLVLNVGGYIGSSTRDEIEYAEAHGKPVQYLDEKVEAKRRYAWLHEPLPAGPDAPEKGSQP